MASWDGEVSPVSTSHCAQSMKSEKVLLLCSMRPASCHAFPSSPPPRMWAMTIRTPRSRRLSCALEKMVG